MSIIPGVRALVKTGCCGRNGCAINAYSNNKRKGIHMKNWIQRHKLYGIGGVVGAIAGFLYWKYIGCLTGSCAITSNPLRSTLYFAVVGALFFSLFRKEQKLNDSKPGERDPNSH